jgi:hypothetical protein
MTAERIIERDLLVEICGALGDYVWALQSFGQVEQAERVAEFRSRLATGLGFKSADDPSRADGRFPIFDKPTRFVEMTRDDFGRTATALMLVAPLLQPMPGAAVMDKQSETHKRLLLDWHADDGEPWYHAPIGEGTDRE